MLQFVRQISLKMNLNRDYYFFMYKYIIVIGSVKSVGFFDPRTVKFRRMNLY